VTGVLLLLQLAIIYLPFMQMFGTEACRCATGLSRW
jgi:hypothetical protein